MSARYRIVLDVALFAAIVVAYAPAVTGIAIHEWLSIAIAVPFFVHMVVNWDWVVRFAKGTMAKLKAASIVNAIVDTALFVSAVAVVLSGLLISQVAAPLAGIAVPSSQLWHSVHSFTADATVLLLFVHFALHATWMAAVFQSLLQRLDRSETGGAALSTSDHS